MSYRTSFRLLAFASARPKSRVSFLSPKPTFLKRGHLVRFVILAAAFAVSLLGPTDQAQAACTVPNQITNGQVADATVVMENFIAITNCAVAPSGSPVTGTLPVFSGPHAISSGDLSGDCSTSGSLVLTCTKANGANLQYFATGTDAGHLTGTISTSRFANGTNADNTTFLRGDGVWAVPPGGGGGGAASGTPVIRASNSQSFNASSVTIPWPTGTVAGDLVIIFVSDGYAVNSPAGWAILNNTGSNDWADGLTAAKIVNAADITAGGGTVTLVGAYNGVTAAVTIDGSTFTHVREVTAARSSGSAGYSSASMVGLPTAESSDLIIGFTYVRGTMSPTISNFTQLQQVNATSASAFLGKYSSAPGKLGIVEAATYPTANNNGYYWSLVALR